MTRRWRVKSANRPTRRETGAPQGAALARFDNRPNCPAYQPLPSHCVSGSGARGISSPLNRQCHPPYQFREISTVKFAPAAPRKEVLKRSFKWRFWLLLSPGTKVTRARERETLSPPAPAGAASSAAVAAPPQQNIKKRPPSATPDRDTLKRVLGLGRQCNCTVCLFCCLSA